MHAARFSGTTSLFHICCRNLNSCSLTTVEFCQTSAGISSGPVTFDFFMLSTAWSNSSLVIAALSSSESGRSSVCWISKKNHFWCNYGRISHPLHVRMHMNHYSNTFWSCNENNILSKSHLLPNTPFNYAYSNMHIMHSDSYYSNSTVPVHSWINQLIFYDLTRILAVLVQIRTYSVDYSY